MGKGRGRGEEGKGRGRGREGMEGKGWEGREGTPPGKILASGRPEVRAQTINQHFNDLTVICLFSGFLR